jgi:Skp family chaperone for outer membrane proteins
MLLKTMKPILFAILLGLGVWLGFPNRADAQTRIATIDLRKVFDEYHKTKTADAALKDEAAELDKERKSLMDNYTTSNEAYQKALDEANNQAISADEREKRKKVAETRLLELKDLEGSITQFDRQARSTLEEKQRRARENILVEIRAAINAAAKLRGLELVIDIAAETVNRTPVVIFNNGSNDITDAILEKLNEGEPTTAAPAPAPAPTPTRPSAPPPAINPKKK